MGAVMCYECPEGTTDVYEQDGIQKCAQPRMYECVSCPDSSYPSYNSRLAQEVCGQPCPIGFSLFPSGPGLQCLRCDDSEDGSVLLGGNPGVCNVCPLGTTRLSDDGARCAQPPTCQCLSCPAGSYPMEDDMTYAATTTERVKCRSLGEQTFHTYWTGEGCRLDGNVHGTARQVNDDAGMCLALRSASVIIFLHLERPSHQQ